MKPMPMRRRLPPYGMSIQTALADKSTWRRFAGTSADGARLTVWLIAGNDGWRLAREWRGARLFLVLPPGADPYTYDWALTVGTGDPVLVAVAGEFSTDELHQLADAVLRDGARAVLAACGSGLLRFTSSRRATA